MNVPGLTRKAFISGEIKGRGGGMQGGREGGREGGMEEPHNTVVIVMHVVGGYLIRFFRLFSISMSGENRYLV
jgi:hypothetical protein